MKFQEYIVLVSWAAYSLWEAFCHCSFHLSMVLSILKPKIEASYSALFSQAVLASLDISSSRTTNDWVRALSLSSCDPNRDVADLPVYLSRFPFRQLLKGKDFVAIIITFP